MALSGTINGLTGNQYIDAKIVWSATQFVSGNYSLVTATLYYKRNNTGYTTSGTWNGSITINGSKQTGSKSGMSITGSSWVQAIQYKDVKVPHNSNGTKSITISATGSISGTSLSSTSVSGTVTLNTIPRASTITSAANVTLGNKCSIKWTPKASGFAYKLKFVCGSKSYTTSVIAPNTTSAYTYSGYTMTVNDWAGAISKYSATCTVTLYTYNSSSADTLIGSDSATFALTVPSSVKPTIALTTTLVNGWNNMYIQGKSKCTLESTFAPSTGSAIKSYSISGGEFSKSGTTSSARSLSGTTSVLTSDETITYTAKVTDGRTTVSTSESIKVWPYADPTVSIVVGRDGSNVNITYNTSWSSLDDKNKIEKIEIYYKTMSATEFGSTPNHTVDLSLITDLNLIKSDTVILSGLDPDTTYDFKAVVVDSYGTSNDSGSIGTGSSFRTININPTKNGIAFGKISEDSSFECALKLGLLTPQHSGEAPGIYCRWDDGKNHDILVRGSDNLTTGLGWVGNDEHITSIDIRPKKAKIRGILSGKEETDPVQINASGLKFPLGAKVYNHQATDNGEFVDIMYVLTGDKTTNGSSCGLAIHKNAVYVPSEANNGVVNLGSSGRKWNQLYAASGTIATSDKNKKQDITLMSSTQKDLFNKLKPTTFKFKNGSRTHYGFISQDVEDSLLELGLDGKDFAGFCKDKKIDEDNNIVLDENGNPIYDYALRYSEFIALNTYMIQELQKEIKTLKAEIDKLKNNN